MALCTVTGIVYLRTGEVARSRTVVFSPAQKRIDPYGAGAALPDNVMVKTSRDGLLSVVLLDGVYIMASGGESARVVVPDALTASLYQILGGGGDIPDAPNAIFEPSIDPATATVGDNVTLTLGTWENATSVVGVLRQGIINRTGEIVDQVWSPAVAGAFTWTVTASGPGGVTVRGPISGLIEEPVAPLVPGDFNVYADGSTPSGAVGSAITSLVSQGSTPVTFAMTGTGADPTKTADAIRFNLGRSFLADGVSLPSGDGFILVADFTANTVTGTQEIIRLGQGTAQIAMLRQATTAAQVFVGVNINGTNTTAVTDTLTVGKRSRIVAEFDRVAGTLRYWNSATGQIVSQPLSYTIPISITRLTFGLNSNVSVHQMSIINRPAGAAWGTTFEEVLFDLGLNGGTPTPEPVPVANMIGFDGIEQSLGLGPNAGAATAPDGRRWREVMGGGTDVLMLNGLVRADGAAISHVASPLLQGYNMGVAPTGTSAAYASGNIPGGLIIAKGLRRDGVVTDPVSYHFNGAGGQEINNFDNDPSNGSGNTLLYNNSEHVMGRARALYVAAGGTYRVPYFLWNQGEADQSLARGQYFTRGQSVLASKIAQIRRLTGQTTDPRIYMLQTGGYARKQNDHWMVLDQIDLARANNMIVVGPNWQAPIDDGNVHHGIIEHIRMHETAVWAIEETQAGRAWNLFPAATAARSGNNITIAIPVRSDETLTTTPGKYAVYGGDPVNLGLEAFGGGTITSATISGGNINLVVSGTVTAIRHAHQRAAGINYADFLDADGKTYVAHRSLIRTTLTRTRTVGGASIVCERWLPSFEVTIT